jgi:hypothetical protein
MIQKSINIYFTITLAPLTIEFNYLPLQNIATFTPRLKDSLKIAISSNFSLV